MIVTLPVPLPVISVLVMPPAVDVNSVALPSATVRVRLTLTLVGSDGSAIAMLLTPIAPLTATDCTEVGVEIAIGPATAGSVFSQVEAMAARS